MALMFRFAFVAVFCLFVVSLAAPQVDAKCCPCGNGDDDPDELRAIIRGALKELEELHDRTERPTTDSNYQPSVCEDRAIGCEGFKEECYTDERKRNACRKTCGL